MEPVGLAVSVVSVATLFRAALDCFEYIQLGKAFSSDLQTCYLRLDSIQLRLSRWGEAVGLGVEIVDSDSLDYLSLSGENIKHAEHLIGQIINLFQRFPTLTMTLRLQTRTSHRAQPRCVSACVTSVADASARRAEQRK